MIRLRQLSTVKVGITQKISLRWGACPIYASIKCTLWKEFIQNESAPDSEIHYEKRRTSMGGQKE